MIQPAANYPMFKKNIFRFPNNKFARFAVSGAVGTMVDLVLLFVFTEWFAIWYLISSVFSFMFGSVTHFTVSRFWVFKNLEKTFWRQYASFFLVHLGGLGVNTLALFVLVEYAHIYYLAAKIITVLFGVSWTFWANKKFTFKKVIPL